MCGPDEARLGGEVGDAPHDLGLGGIGPHVEDEDLAVVEPARPEEAPVVGEAHVVRLAAPAHRDLVDDLAVLLGGGIGVDGDELVEAVAEALHPERPDVDVVLLPLDEVAHVGGVARLVGERGGDADGEDGGEEKREPARKHS